MRKKSRLSWFILAVFMMTIAFGGVMPNVASAANLTDVQDHWASTQINAMVDQGIVAGYPNNTFKPNANITRAEFIVLSNKSFAFNNTAEINYSDVKSSDWFANDIAKAKAAGYISGYADGTMKPNNNISRQEAAVIVANILKLNSAGSDELKKFKDASSIPAWSASSVAALVKGGILAGYPDGTFQPKKAITRAEAVVILTKAKGTTTPSKPEPKPEPGIDLSKISKAGTYGPATGNQAISGDVTISASGVTLQNVTVSGDLTITDAVGNGDVTLKNVTVKGTAYIKGGGANSIHLNNCVLGKVVINKAGGNLRVALEGSTSISNLVADSSVNVVGKGTITKATINAANVTIETKPGTTTVANNISATVAGETVKGSTSSSGGGGGGGSSTNTVSISGIANQTVVAGSSITLTVTTSPADATVQASSSNPNVALVSVNGKTITINGNAAGSTSITISASKTGYTTGTITFSINVTSSGTSITPGTPTKYPFYGNTNLVEVPFTVSDSAVTANMISVKLNDNTPLTVDSTKSSGSKFIFSGATTTALDGLTYADVTVNKNGTITTKRIYFSGSEPEVITITPGTPTKVLFVANTNLVEVPFTVGGGTVTSAMITVTLNDNTPLSIDITKSSGNNFVFSGATTTALAAITSATITVSKPGTAVVSQNVNFPDAPNQDVNVTTAIGSPSTSGFVLTLSPAVSGLQQSNFALKDASNNPVIFTVTEANSGAQYNFAATLTAGQAYTLTTTKTGYVFGGATAVNVPNVGTINILVTEKMKMDFYGATMAFVKFTVSGATVTASDITVKLNDNFSLNHEVNSSFTFSGTTNTPVANVTSATITVNKAGYVPVSVTVNF